MPTTFFLAASLLIWSPHQERPTTEPLPMRRLEACRIELSPLCSLATSPETVEYRADVSREGFIQRLTLVGEPFNPPEERSMRRLVRLDQFESCVKRWQFGVGGNCRLVLQGGSYRDGNWFITASQGRKSLRFVQPQRFSAR